MISYFISCLCLIAACDSLVSGGSGSVVIPDGVFEIPANYYRNCSALTSIELPPSVNRIGDGAFSDCTNLKSVAIRSTRSGGYMGTKAFSGASSLSCIYAASAGIVNSVISTCGGSCASARQCSDSCESTDS